MTEKAKDELESDGVDNEKNDKDDVEIPPPPKPDMPVKAGKSSDVTETFLKEWNEFKARNPKLFEVKIENLPTPETIKPPPAHKEICMLGPLCLDWK